MTFCVSIWGRRDGECLYRSVTDLLHCRIGSLRFSHDLLPQCRSAHLVVKELDNHAIRHGIHAHYEIGIDSRLFDASGNCNMSNQLWRVAARDEKVAIPNPVALVRISRCRSIFDLVRSESKSSNG